jgi:hypothetical protein
MSACLRLQSGLRRRPHEDWAGETYRYFKVKIFTSIRLSFLKDLVKEVHTVDFFTLRQNDNNNNNNSVKRSDATLQMAHSNVLSSSEE